MSETFYFSELADHAATGFERAHMDAMAGAMHSLPAELIDTIWDAQTARADILPLIAHGMSVNLYEDVWSLETKRNWITNNWRFLALRGTLAGVRMALEVNGFDLQEVLRPPQGFYASPEMTKAEHDAWIKLMPELRITFQARTGHDNGQWFADDGFVDEAFAGLDDGPALYGNYAFIRQNGVERPLHNISFVQSVERRTAREVQTYSTIGLSTYGWFADDGAADGDFYVDAGERPAEIYSFVADEAYDHVTSTLELSTISPNLTPIDSRYEIDSDTGWWGFQTFSADAIAGEDFAGADDAGLLLARRIYLLDPAVQVPRTLGFSFADYDRVGMPLRTAEMLVNLRQKAGVFDAFAEDVIADEVYALPEDTRAQDRAFRAIEAARGHLDTVLVRFDHQRPLEFSDEITEGSLVGDWVQNSL